MARRIDGLVVLGAILVVLGALFLAGQLAPVSFDVGHYGWPVVVILPGLAFLAFGLFLDGASGLVIPGSIITIAGLVLAVQNTFDLFATWAYAWALVAPGGVGLGIALQGIVRHSPAETPASRRSPSQCAADFVRVTCSISSMSAGETTVSLATTRIWRERSGSLTRLVPQLPRSRGPASARESHAARPVRRRVKSRFASLGSRLTEAGDVGVDQARVER